MSVVDGNGFGNAIIRALGIPADKKIRNMEIKCPVNGLVIVELEMLVSTADANRLVNVLEQYHLTPRNPEIKQ